MLALLLLPLALLGVYGRDYPVGEGDFALKADRSGRLGDREEDICKDLGGHVVSKMGSSVRQYGCLCNSGLTYNGKECIVYREPVARVSQKEKRATSMEPDRYNGDCEGGFKRIFYEGSGLCVTVTGCKPEKDLNIINGDEWRCGSCKTGSYYDSETFRCLKCKKEAHNNIKPNRLTACFGNIGDSVEPTKAGCPSNMELINLANFKRCMPKCSSGQARLVSDHGEFTCGKCNPGAYFNEDERQCYKCERGTFTPDYESFTYDHDKKKYDPTKKITGHIRTKCLECLNEKTYHTSGVNKEQTRCICDTKIAPVFDWADWGTRNGGYCYGEYFFGVQQLHEGAPDIK